MGQEFTRLWRALGAVSSAEFEQTAPHAVMTHAKPTADFAGTRDWID